MLGAHAQGVGDKLEVATLEQTLLFAHRQDTDGANTLQEFTFESPDLYIGTVAIPATQLHTSQPQIVESLESFGTTSSSAFLDTRSGRWATLLLKTPMVPGTANNLTWASFANQPPRSEIALGDLAWDAFYRWLKANAGVLAAAMATRAPNAMACVTSTGPNVSQVYLILWTGPTPTGRWPNPTVHAVPRLIAKVGLTPKRYGICGTVT